MNISDEKAYYVNNILTIYFIAIICFVAIYSFVYIPDYETYEISDWMINYEGGFVRRGLIGQCLLWANHIHSFDIRYAIVLIEAFFYVLFLYLIFKIFNKYKWSLLGAMFPIVCSTTSLTVYRRDFMMLCLCYLSYKLFFRYLKDNRINSLIISIMIMSVSITIYEPIFFVMVPVLVLQYWNKKKNIINSLFIFLIPILCMVLSCIFRGTDNQVNDIWQSWLPYLSQYVDIQNENIGFAIQFLGLTNQEVFSLHYECTFRDNMPLWTIITLIIVFSLAYFLCTYVPSVYREGKRLCENFDKYELSKILLFQLFIQLPIFTFLSCDYGRTIPMSLYTSFFIFHMSKKNGYKVYVTNIIGNTSDKIINSLNSYTVFNNPWVYIFTILLFPFHTFAPSLVYDNIIVHSLQKIIKYLI